MTAEWVVKFMEEETAEIRLARDTVKEEGNHAYADRLAKQAEAYEIAIKLMQEKAAAQ